MCGLTGFWDTAGGPAQGELESTVRRMAATLFRRGPDDGGEWADAACSVALGFRRLAIVDLSPAGHQPMASATGRYVIAFNGEVYNVAALRRELEDGGEVPCFRGRSDTEVMLAAIEAWGLEGAVTRFVGMFAFALWDRRERRLSLVRDRLGIKPLYYGWAGRTFLFGSELKALRAHPAFRADVDRGALALFLRHNYIPAPYSIYQGIRKLMPGTLVTLAAEDAGTDPIPQAYWSMRQVAETGVGNPFTGSDAEAVEQLDGLLREAVGLRMVADVPLGAFLSGGVDSSTVVALMQAQSGRPVKTFSIGFSEQGYDESVYAKEVARHLGTEHQELHLTTADAMAVIPRLPEMYDEPFADSSQIPTYLVSELARRHVTVSLSGDGGDELFGGYNRYALGRRLWGRMAWMPPALRRGTARGLRSVSPRAWNAVARMAPPRLGLQKLSDKAGKVACLLEADSLESTYMSLVSHWPEPTALTLGGQGEPPTPLTDRARWPALSDPTLRMMYLDTLTYLPDDILTKVDRASMGISLEARVPLLDHRLVEFAWQVPLSMKVRGAQSKWLLRQVLYRYVPPALIERPKMGFGIPIGDWLRGGLRDWAESLLDERRLRDEGFFDPAPIRAKWQEHLSGRQNWQYHLWDILMFQAWLEGNK